MKKLETHISTGETQWFISTGSKKCLAVEMCSENNPLPAAFLLGFFPWPGGPGGRVGRPPEGNWNDRGARWKTHGISLGKWSANGAVSWIFIGFRGFSGLLRKDEESIKMYLDGFILPTLICVKSQRLRSIHLCFKLILLASWSPVGFHQKTLHGLSNKCTVLPNKTNTQLVAESNDQEKWWCPYVYI